ncbi:MAG: hypothetical protein H7Z41_08500 [Cytophagales bacterium]|nr:hypothetical protein [Armatimonadota bacterium]
MKTPLAAGETIVKEGGANLQHDLESVGGRLFLTTHRLIFESHALNVQTGVTILPLFAITEVQRCWTKFLNAIPLANNSVAVTMNQGVTFRFVVFGAPQWVAAIQSRQSPPLS